MFSPGARRSSRELFRSLDGRGSFRPVDGDYRLGGSTDGGYRI